jgi:hypothetical protein
MLTLHAASRRAWWRAVQLNRPAVVFDLGKTALYGHSFQDPHTVILGFGDGTIQVQYSDC